MVNPMNISVTSADGAAANADYDNNLDDNLLHSPFLPAPVCKACSAKTTSVDFGFTVSCSECVGNLHSNRQVYDRKEAFGSIATCMRQWDKTQEDIALFMDELQILGVDLTSVDAVSGMAPLHFAARSGAANIGDDERAAKVVAQLLNQGADINQRCHYASMTPLHYAALYGCPWVITELSRTRPYRSAVDLNAVILEDHGGSSYHLAVIGGHPEVIRALLAAGADHTRVNGANHTPLEAALAHYESGAIERHDLATEEELRLIIELLKGVENRIPHGRWIDLQGEFCGGAVIEIRRDGTGVNEDTRQAITTTSLGDGRFYIQQDGDHVRNEHTRSGSILIGTAVTANGTKLPNHRHVGSSPLGRPRNGNNHGHDASRSMWQLQDVADLERARAEREKIEAERQRLRDEEARKAKAAADEQERLERERSLRERLEQEELEKLRAEQEESEKLRAQLMPPPDDNHGDLDSRATTPSASPEKEWEPIYVGDRVLVNKKRVGLVRYKGPVDFLHGYGAT